MDWSGTMIQTLSIAASTAQPDSLGTPVPPTSIDPPAVSGNVQQVLTDAWNSVQSLPWSAHALAGAGFILGLAMWLRGKDLVRPLFALLGAFKGAVAGFAAPAFFGLSTIAGFSAPIVGLIVGAITGLGAGIALYRFAMAISGALVTGIAGVLIAGAWLGLTPPQLPATPASPESALSILGTPGEPTGTPPAPLTPEPPEAEAQDGPGSGSIPTASEQIMLAAKPAAQRVRVFIEAWWQTLGDSWRALTTQQQGTLIVGGMGGLVAGFLIGSLMPGKLAAIFTSLLGSAIVLCSGTWLVRAFDAPGQSLLNQGAREWLVIWLVTAAVGLLVQIGPSLRGKAKAKGGDE